MFPEIDRFARWLRCQSPNAATHRHYASDLKLFFAWADKRPEAITFRDVDAYVTHCRELGHAGTTVNRRLAAVRAFYRFLDLESGSAPANPVLPGRHFIRKGRRLPRDSRDDDLDRLFAVVTTPGEAGDDPTYTPLRAAPIASISHSRTLSVSMGGRPGARSGSECEHAA